MPIGPGPWRDQLAARLRSTNLPQVLQIHLASASWRLHGKRISEPLAKDLVDQVLRLDMPGVRGGMPTSGRSSFRHLQPPEAHDNIECASDIEPQATSESAAEQVPLPCLVALAVSHTLSGTSSVVATEANPAKF